MELWNSSVRMGQLSRTAGRAAVVLMLVGGLALPFRLIVAVPCLVLSLTSVLCAMFSWFRMDHLRELERHS
jgi:hypothetical protein